MSSPTIIHQKKSIKIDTRADGDKVYEALVGRWNLLCAQFELGFIIMADITFMKGMLYLAQACPCADKTVYVQRVEEQIATQLPWIEAAAKIQNECSRRSKL